MSDTQPDFELPLAMLPRSRPGAEPRSCSIQRPCSSQPASRVSPSLVCYSSTLHLFVYASPGPAHPSPRSLPRLCVLTVATGRRGTCSRCFCLLYCFQEGVCHMACGRGFPVCRHKLSISRRPSSVFANKITPDTM